MTGAYNLEAERVIVVCVGASPTERAGRVGGVDGAVVGLRLGVVPNLTVRGGDAWLGRAAIAESAGLVLLVLDEAVESWLWWGCG